MRHHGSTSLSMRCTHADYVRYPCVRTTWSRTLAERLTVIMYWHAMCPRRLVSVERSGRLLHLKAWLVSYVSRQYIYVCMSDCLSFCLSVSLSHGLPVTVCASLSLLGACIFSEHLSCSHSTLVARHLDQIQEQAPATLGVLQDFPHLWLSVSQ